MIHYGKIEKRILTYTGMPVSKKSPGKRDDTRIERRETGNPERPRDTNRC